MNIQKEVETIVAEYNEEDISLKETAREIVEKVRKAEKEKRDKEEYEFLDKILHMPFFEFCLLVKERKQALTKGGANEK